MTLDYIRQFHLEGSWRSYQMADATTRR